MTGTPRMCERPIGILVDALRSLGAKITYEKMRDILLCNWRVFSIRVLVNYAFVGM